MIKYAVQVKSSGTTARPDRINLQHCGASKKSLWDIAMPEYRLPEFNRALSPLMDAVDETLGRIRDFRAALQGADSPSAVITEYELLRKQHSTVKIVIEIRRRGKGVR